LLKLRNPFFELEPNSVLRTDDPDRTGIAPDARKAVQQPFKQNSTWDHPNWYAPPVHDRSQVHGGDRATRGCHDAQGGQQLTGPIHIDPQLPQNRRAIGPDSYGAATCLHIWPPFDDVTSWPSRNNPRAMEMPPTPAPTTRIRSDRVDGAFGTGLSFAERL
jgi:hypothetical protein